MECHLKKAEQGASQRADDSHQGEEPEIEDSLHKSIKTRNRINPQANRGCTQMLDQIATLKWKSSNAAHVPSPLRFSLENNEMLSLAVITPMIVFQSI